jgi:putative phosphoribosyl transferase
VTADGIDDHAYFTPASKVSGRRGGEGDSLLERLRDRKEAGRLLAKKLTRYSGRSDVLVLGLPRGGVPVAIEISRLLKVPLDVLIVRKLKVPGFEDFSMGAISVGGARFINPDAVEEFRVSQAQIDVVVSAETKEMERLEGVYRGRRPRLDVRGRTVILVDDGVITGSTMRAAVEALKRLGTARVIVAVGVAPLSTSLLLGPETDEVICLLTPREVPRIGLFYESFPQLTEDYTSKLLERATGSGSRTAA